MRGPEGVFMDLATNPQDVKKFVEIIGDYMIEIGKRQLETSGVNGIVIWGDVAYKNGMFFSPKTWKEIFYPVVKKVCNKFKKYNIPIIYHGCGDSRAILDDLNEAGIPRDDTLIKVGNFKKRSGIELTKEILQMENRPEAIFVSNIDMTLGTLITIREMRLKIPDDIGVVGFDDPEWAPILDPPITTVSQPVYSLGSTSAEMLIKRINGEQIGLNNKPIVITLNTELIIRSSTKNVKK